LNSDIKSAIFSLVELDLLIGGEGGGVCEAVGGGGVVGVGVGVVGGGGGVVGVGTVDAVGVGDEGVGVWVVAGVVVARFAVRGGVGLGARFAIGFGLVVGVGVGLCMGSAVGGAGAVGALGVEADLGGGGSFVGTVDQKFSLICSISLRSAAFSASSSSYVGFFLDIM
jgi:hypothetical protein